MILSHEDATFLDRLFARPVKYLSVMSSEDTKTTTIQDYCYDFSLVAQIDPSYPLWVVVLPADKAQYVCDRLGSGLHGARIHDTFVAAVEQASEFVYRFIDKKGTA